MQVTKLGDGLGVSFPASMVEALNLHEGDDVEICVTPKKKAHEAAKQAEIHDALVRLRKYRGLLPKDFRFDREEANARR